MKDFGYLLKAVSGSMFSLGRKNRKTSNKSSVWSVILTQCFAGALIAVVFGFQTYSSFSLLTPFLTDDLAFKYIADTMASSIVCIIGFTCTYVFSVFFMSKNDEAFIPLPIKPSMLFLARFVISLIFAFSYSLLLLIQGMVFAIMYSFSIYKIIGAIVIFLTVPLISVSVSFIILNTLGKIFNFKKHKWAGNVVTIVLIIAATVALVLMSLSGTADGDEASNYVSFIETTYENYRWISWIAYIPSKMVSYSDASSLLYCLYQLLICIGFIGLALLSAKLFYFNNLGNEGNKKKRRVGEEKIKYKMAKSFTGFAKSEFLCDYRREFNVMKNNSAGMIYAIFMPLVMTATAICILFPLRYGSGDDFASLFSDIRYAYIAVSLGCVFESIMPIYSFCSISFEGKSFTSLMAMPLNDKKYLDAKLLGNVTITLSLNILMTLVFVFGLQVSPWVVILSLVANIPFIFLENEISLILGVKFAKFDYDNPAEVTQKGWGPFFIGLISYGMVIGFVGINLGLSMAVPTYLCFIPSLITFVICSISLYFARRGALTNFGRMKRQDNLF